MYSFPLRGRIWISGDFLFGTDTLLQFSINEKEDGIELLLDADPMFWYWINMFLQQMLKVWLLWPNQNLMIWVTHHPVSVHRFIYQVNYFNNWRTQKSNTFPTKACCSTGPICFAGTEANASIVAALSSWLSTTSSRDLKGAKPPGPIWWQHATAAMCLRGTRRWSRWACSCERNLLCLHYPIFWLPMRSGKRWNGCPIWILQCLNREPSSTNHLPNSGF